jgi:hypothetical protein
MYSIVAGTPEEELWSLGTKWKAIIKADLK